DVDRGDRLPVVDERLQDLRHAGALEALRAPAGELVVDAQQRGRARGREHRHADELAVCVRRGDLGTDPQDPTATVGRHEAAAVRRRLGGHEVERASGRRQPRAVGVVERPVDDDRNLRPAGQAPRQRLRPGDGFGRSWMSGISCGSEPAARITARGGSLPAKRKRCSLALSSDTPTSAYTSSSVAIRCSTLSACPLRRISPRASRMATMAARSAWLAKIAMRNPARESSAEVTPGYVVGTATSGTPPSHVAAKDANSPKSLAFEWTRTASAPAAA